MPISKRELIDEYGQIVNAGNASLFVGAGLSLSAGYPTWPALLETPRADAKIPDSITDLPLVAEYYINEQPGGLQALHAHIVNMMKTVEPTPTQGHLEIARLPIPDLWTTNYDPLMEIAAAPIDLIELEDHFKRTSKTRRRLVKLHGSLAGHPLSWKAEPIISRSDYEKYEEGRPRMWSALRAAYLTRSFLFLGFSFADPNIEVMLRLARKLDRDVSPKHFTLMRRPTNEIDLRRHELLVADLEKSGVQVCEIADYLEINEVLQRLVRRTRPPSVFISGSATEEFPVNFAFSLGQRLAEIPQLRLTSLASKPAMFTSFGLANIRRSTESYDPYDTEFHFRYKEGESVVIDQRTGVMIHHNAGQMAVLKKVLDESRVCVVLGGGEQTHKEAEMALAFDIPLIPAPTTGGTAAALYAKLAPETALWSDDISDDDRRDWALLNDAKDGVALAALTRLIVKSAYLGTDRE